MSATKVLHVTLPIELARMVEEKVASGEYANESEVVRDALEAPATDDEAIERWLREEVVPTYDALKRDPSRAIPLAEAKKRIEAHMKRRNAASEDA